MNRRQAIAALGLPLLFAACSEDRASYRYKLMLSVDTPEGVKSGFSVVEVNARKVTLPERGTLSAATGEAVYVDLGEGARPIVAVMTPRVPRKRTLEWGEGMPELVGLLQLYG